MVDRNVVVVYRNEAARVTFISSKSGDDRMIEIAPTLSQFLSMFFGDSRQ